MIKGKEKYLILIFVGGLIFVFLYNNMYTEFRPVVFENNSYKYLKAEGDTGFFRNLKTVLDHYSVDYKVSEHGNILIRWRLYLDKELLSNYTKKALDEEWLNSHGDIKDQ